MSDKISIPALTIGLQN